MIDAFRNGEDLHRAIAAVCLHKPAGGVTPEERRLGKAVNFGFLYGQGVLNRGVKPYLAPFACSPIGEIRSLSPCSPQS